MSGVLPPIPSITPEDAPSWGCRDGPVATPQELVGVLPVPDPSPQRRDPQTSIRALLGSHCRAVSVLFLQSNVSLLPSLFCAALCEQQTPQL